VHAAWPTCDQCQWRDDVDGLAASSQQQLRTIRDHRAEGIRRTEFGVRGVWHNHLTRDVAATLVKIFCDALVQRLAEAALLRPGEGESGTQIDDATPRRLAVQPLVTGFDGRHASLDLFVGVTTAIREFGLPVLDVGRCTAASILEAARALPDVQAAVIVTGSGGGASVTGFDVFDSAGDPVAVRWKDYGIHVSAVTGNKGTATDAERTPETPAQDSEVKRTRHFLRIDRQHQTLSRLRMARSYGSHDQIAFEDRYRNGLLRWFPRHSTIPVVVRAQDPYVLDRVRWLATKCDVSLTCAGPAEGRVTAPHGILINIPDDDRQLTVVGRTGKPIAPVVLAERINGAIHSSASQITAHADSVTGRFWLTDAARPTSRLGNEHITDALATAGLLLRLAAQGMSLS
jgi:hypothetical protein